MRIRCAAACLFAVMLAWQPLAAQEVVGAQEIPPEVADILENPSSQDDYHKSVRCIPTARIRSAKALDDQHVVFELGRRQYYLVQLPRRCPGMKAGRPVAYKTTTGSSLCRLDTIHGLLDFGVGDSRLGPSCVIPTFQEISVEQLDLLRETARNSSARN